MYAQPIAEVRHLRAGIGSEALDGRRFETIPVFEHLPMALRAIAILIGIPIGVVAAPIGPSCSSVQHYSGGPRVDLVQKLHRTFSLTSGGLACHDHQQHRVA